MEVTEPVDALRAVNETESRLPFLKVDVVAVEMDWRGTRDVDRAGDTRRDECLNVFAGVSSTSMTPNSFAVPDGEGLPEESMDSPRPITALARRTLRADPDPFKGGEAVVEVRLDIRGIFVGV